MKQILFKTTADSALRVVHGTTIVLKRQDFDRDLDAVFIGDSMVFGLLARKEEIFMARLQEETGMRILNLGISARHALVAQEPKGFLVS